MLQSTYSLPLVVASLFIATLASYTTLNLASRIASLSGNDARAKYWLTGGSLSMGAGIWCMHFVGMLSFSLPIRLGYDLLLTGMSLLIAVGVSYCALRLATRKNLSFAGLLASGILMGLGIASMHYVGMAALKIAPGIEYQPLIVGLSILVAAGAATAALWISRSLRYRTTNLMGWRLGAALLMGAAISGMHYVGMAAAGFPEGAICLAASDLSPNWLAFTIAGATFSILTITLVLSVMDARLEASTNAYTASLTAANEQLHHQATHDALTGLPNRPLLLERIRHAMDTAERTGNPFALYFIDLDGFKGVNDTLGHAVGDALLQSVAQRLKAAVRKEDIVARLGGDEFVVMVTSIPDVEMAGHIAEKLFTCFGDEFSCAGSRIQISPSIGIALYPEDGKSVDELLVHADAAMYSVKSAGRNGYQFFEAAMNASTRRAIEIQRRLPAALKAGEFKVVYQPKFDCENNQMEGAEALLRWDSPDLGAVKPDEFILVAERSGHIVKLGLWVIEEVCLQLRAWCDNPDLAMPRIAINLSQIQLRSSRLVTDIVGIATRYGIAPALLMFEITETVAMENTAETLRTIDALQAAGFDLAIDDFGTGYSSLSRLQQLGVQQMKVDRSFISALTVNEKGREIVATIIRLAHNLGMEVVAEGVETEAQLALLRALKCDQTQGFLLGEPMTGNELVRLISRQPAVLDR